MKSMRSRQLTFVFADSPRGGKGARPTDEFAGKAYLLHRAKGMPTSDLIAPAADTSRLLEQVASESNLAAARWNATAGVPYSPSRAVPESCKRGWARLLVNRGGSAARGIVLTRSFPSSGLGTRARGLLGSATAVADPGRIVARSEILSSAGAPTTAPGFPCGGWTSDATRCPATT